MQDENTRETSRWRWTRLAPWLAPLLLVAVALQQIVLAQRADLSPWKGGGYGMFSSVDHGGTRSVRVFALGGGRETRLGIPPGLVNRSYRVRDLPAPAALAGFGRAVAGETPELPLAADRVRVEVWRRLRDPQTLEPRRELLRQHEVALR